MADIPEYFRRFTIEWTGWNIDDVYNLIPHKGIEHYHRIETKETAYGNDLIIYGPNMTGSNGPLVHIAHPGDSVCYDKGLGGGVSIIRQGSYNLDLFNVTNAKVELPKERPAELELSIQEKIAWVKKEIKKLEDAGINTYADTVRIAMFRGYLECLETKKG